MMRTGTMKRIQAEAQWTEQGRGPAARLWPADALRGLALLNMLLYHGMYDWVYVFEHTSWYNIGAPGCHVWQQYICWSFIFLSGFSVGFSRRPWKSGLLTGACALVLTAVTLLVMPQERILFGVLHFLACAMLLTAGLAWCARRLSLRSSPRVATVGLVVSAAAFVLTERLPFGGLGFGRVWLALPRTLYDTNLFWLGFQDIGHFYSADYFPLMPWLFLFWCGCFAFLLLRNPLLRRRAAEAKQENEATERKVAHRWFGAAPRALRWLCTAGRHTLLVYMLHQPVLMVVVWLVDRLV